MSKPFWGRQIRNFNYGQMLIGKIQFILTGSILLKVFNITDPYVYIASGIGYAVFVWLAGYIFERSGIRKEYVESSFQGVKIENKREHA